MPGFQRDPMRMPTVGSRDQLARTTTNVLKPIKPLMPPRPVVPRLFPPVAAQAPARTPVRPSIQTPFPLSTPGLPRQPLWIPPQVNPILYGRY